MNGPSIMLFALSSTTWDGLSDGVAILIIAALLLIGLFLGYPPEDVEGFCRNKGQNCKLCGLWKVYGRVDTAEKMFRLYALCREHLYGQLEAGTPFAQLLEAV